MRKLWKNTKGAVTVFVSLMLIPAILVSGSAVDLARIHTARSIVQDANQLAANSVLTQYNAMLQDIYGLYAVMEDDPILSDMLNKYIDVAVFGEKSTDRELGTFQLFYDSNIQPATFTPAKGKNLRNIDVMRRQIEEYAKFRAPVIVVGEIFERIDKFKKLKEDAEVIEKKMQIDEKINEIDGIYEEIYKEINEINSYPSDEKLVFNSINGYLTQINVEMRELKKTRDEWIIAYDANNSDLMGDLERKYNSIKRNIKALVSKGDVGSAWIPGDYDDNGNWVKGEWSSKTYSEGINKAIVYAKELLNTYIPKMDLLVDKCKVADEKKENLAKMVDELEGKINSGSCSSELKDGMTKPDESGKSIIEQYRDLLSYSLKPMAEAMKNENEPHINATIGIFDDVAYGDVLNNVLSTPYVSLEELKDLSKQEFEISSTGIMPENLKTLNHLATLSNYKYTAPNSFKLFQDATFNSTNNKTFYDVLSERYNNASNDNEKGKAKESIRELLKKAQELFKTVTLTPDGAKYYKTDDKTKNSSGFGSEGNWEEEKEAENQTKNALNKNIISQIGGFFDEAGSKILLLTYDTEMFSNFTTVSGDKTMSGVPMSTDVNYFFQSELEYLYHGNEKSAYSNIATVSGLIFLVRFVFNYKSTFVIDEIRYELSLISAPAGPYKLIVKELARLGYAMAESAIDIKEILARPSRAVPIFKTQIRQWAFSLHGSLESIPETLMGFAIDEQGTQEGGMFYIDYLRILLLFKDGDTLAKRTADLIAWNMTNKKGNFNANESSMANAPLFDMSKAYTDFTISTTVDLRMLFLSMPFAQKGVNGVIPPKTLPVTVTDYRGY